MFIWISLLFAAAASHAQTTLQYINNNVAYAQELMRENHIPASIILAVAIHESAAGTSKIAKYLNNHFGVKGKNSSKKIKSAYKGYSSVEDSYDHFVEVLQDKVHLTVFLINTGQITILAGQKAYNVVAMLKVSSGPLKSLLSLKNTNCSNTIKNPGNTCKQYCLFQS